METVNYLHDVVRHTNRITPISRYIDINKYPEQMDIVGTRVEITYRPKDMAKQAYLTTTPTSVNRPADDTDDYDARESQEFKEAYNATCTFLVMRADNEKPYNMVLLSDNFETLIVTDSRYYTNPKCNIVPKQDAKFIGYKVKVHFVDRFEEDIDKIVEAIPVQQTVTEDEYKGAYIVSSDMSEPGRCAIVQYVDNRTYKVFLDDECLIELLEAPDFDDRDDTWKIRELRRVIIEGRSPYGRV